MGYGGIAIGCCGVSLKGHKRIKTILNHYGKNKDSFWRAILEYYSNSCDFDEALKRASRFEDEQGRCEAHQRRIYGVSKRKFAQEMGKKKSDIQNCSNFEDVYRLLKAFKVKGIGELVVYDTAMRLSAYLGQNKNRDFRPKFVYLHNGAAKGASILRKKGLILYGGQCVPVSVFSKIFPGKEAYEIEEILCIYKENF